MALNFPSSPTLNQTYTVSNKTWRWNGSAWDLNPADLATANAAYTTANVAYDTANSAYNQANTSLFLPIIVTEYGGILSATDSGVSILDRRVYRNRPISELQNTTISTAQSATFNDQIGSLVSVSRHFVCNNATESTFILPSANDVSQGFNLTFDIVNSGNLIFEVSSSNTEVIRFGPNRATQVKIVNIDSILQDTIGNKQFNSSTAGISFSDSVLTFSGQQNIYTLKFIRINSTDYMLAR